MPQLRLDKIICDAGLASRSEARRMIADGRASVNGTAVKTADAKFDPETADIRLDGVPVCAHALRYFMLNKPDGVLSATEDPAQKTVLDLLPPELRHLGLFPVGRLDKDTTGLLILSNDGALCHEATSPRHHVDKVYAFTVDGMLTQEDAEALAAGVELRDGTVCRSAQLTIDPDEPTRGTLAISEGKYHQVKRMLAARGKHVLMLERLSMGGLTLDPALAPGACRELTETETALLLQKKVTV